MSATKSRDAMSPVSIKRAMSKKAEVIEPFQYFSEVGEEIRVFDFSSHEGVARLYVHVDVGGQVMARVLQGDDFVEGYMSEGYIETNSSTILKEPEGFGQLLYEMHLAAEQSEREPFDVDEMDELIAKSRSTPIVIGGCGRSGTTLLLSILGAHPAILAFPDELYALYPKPFRLKKLLWALAEYGEKPGWQRWCEKTPKNVRSFASIDAAFAGKVHLIHIVRDGRDVVSSHHPNAEDRYYISPERWIADVRAGLEEQDNTLIVRYEDLVSDTKNTLLKICEFVGEKFDEDMMAFEQHSSVKTNKAWEGGSARALHKKQIGRWRAAEHKERVEKLLQTPGAEELLEELGYL